MYSVGECISRVEIFLAVAILAVAIVTNRALIQVMMPSGMELSKCGAPGAFQN